MICLQVKLYFPQILGERFASGFGEIQYMISQVASHLSLLRFFPGLLRFTRYAKSLDK